MPMKRNTNSGQRSAVSNQPERAAARHTARVIAINIVALILLPGCGQLGAFIAVMKGGETLPPDFKLARGPLAIVLDDPNSLGVPTDAMRTFHDILAQEFQEQKINSQVVAFSELQKLRQNDQFDDLSIRQIGEKLGAEQVLYCKVTYWALKENAGDPHFKGKCTVGMKVNSTEPKRDVKLWPTDRDHVVVAAHTDPDLNTSTGAEAQVSRKLAEKLAAAVGSYFRDHKARERLE